MSQTYIAAIVSILSLVLPKLGIVIGNEELTITISTIVSLISTIWIMVRRHQVGDITIAGMRK